MSGTFENSQNSLEGQVAQLYAQADQLLNVPEVLSQQRDNVDLAVVPGTVKLTVRRDTNNTLTSPTAYSLDYLSIGSTEVNSRPLSLAVGQVCSVTEVADRPLYLHVDPRVQEPITALRSLIDAGALTTDGYSERLAPLGGTLLALSGQPDTSGEVVPMDEGAKTFVREAETLLADTDEGAIHRSLRDKVTYHSLVNPKAVELSKTTIIRDGSTTTAYDVALVDDGVRLAYEEGIPLLSMGRPEPKIVSSIEPHVVRGDGKSNAVLLAEAVLEVGEDAGAMDYVKRFVEKAGPLSSGPTLKRSDPDADSVGFLVEAVSEVVANPDEWVIVRPRV
ncbi:MAG TPA: hypothetical protein VK674_07535 [Candidatus Limnocylindria bacterium]|nr:hypothetical protein [Candidatus Limnocylindria bacterium]